MKKVFLSTAMVLVLLTSVFGQAFAADNNSAALQDLAMVRQVTAKYHDVNAAIADGYVSMPGCAYLPGVGGMGYHYINFGLAMDPAIDAEQPEALLYIDSGQGLRLIAVEYFYAIGAPDAPIPNPAPPAPSLFGRTFDGPMLGHEPGMPPHYDLHVWLWQANPSGIFAQFNPNVSCP